MFTEKLYELSPFLFLVENGKNKQKTEWKN